MKRSNRTAALRRAFASSAVAAAIATLFVFSAGAASAQDAPPPPPQGGFQFQGPGGPGGPGMRGGPAMGLPRSAQLVTRPDVAKDLALTQDQKDQIRTVMDKVREKMRSMMPAPGDGGEDQRPDPQTMRAAMQKMQAESDKAIASVLTSAQAARLKEIKFQLAGSSAALDKDVQAQIGITADQKVQIQAAIKAQREKMMAQGGPGGPGGGADGFGGPPPGGGQGGDQGGPPPGGGQGGPGGGPGGFGGPGGGPGGMNPMAEKAHKELNAAIDAILTDAQKAQLKSMAGTKPFIEDKRPQRGGPDGQGGPGGPGGFGPGGLGGGGGIGG